MTQIVWLKAKCPICLELYDYPDGGYKPKTCSKFECIHKYNHPYLSRNCIAIEGGKPGKA